MRVHVIVRVVRMHVCEGMRDACVMWEGVRGACVCVRV